MRPTPRPGMLSIAPYVAGKSAVSGHGRIIKLSSNENGLGPSPKALEAYHAAAATLHRYADGNATRLKAVIAALFRVSEESIVTGAGSDEVIGLLVHAFAGEGDEVLYSQHGFLMYKIYTQAAGATPVTAPEKDYTTSVDALLSAVTARTKIVFVANPNNPTGTYISGAELARLRRGLPSHVVLVVDAAYSEYALAEEYADGLELARTTDNTVMLRTFSKAYGLPGLRLGYGVMHSTLADVLNRVRGPFNVSAPALAAGEAALRDQAYIAACVQHNTRARAAMTAALSGYGLQVLPSEGNFIAVRFADAASASACNTRLMEAGIIVREVINYGMPEFLRITVGTVEENDAVVQCIKGHVQ